MVTQIHDPLTIFFYYGTYYFVWAICILWIVNAAIYCRSKPLFLKNLWLNYNVELLLPWLLVGFIALTVLPTYNIPTLEMTGLGTAKSLFLDRTIRWRYDLLLPSDLKWMNLQLLVEFKPVLFPFLLSLIHHLLGYKAANVFLLNLIIAGLFLSAVYICCRQWTNRILSFSILLLIAAGPVFSLCARTASSDLFCTFLLGLSFIYLYNFMKSPTGPSFGLLWSTLILLAYAREESIMYFFIILAALFFKDIRWRTLREHWIILGGTAFLLSPVIWLRIVKIGAHKQLMRGNPSASPMYLKNNIFNFLSNQFNFSLDIPYNTPVHWLAFFILTWLFVNTVITKKIHLQSFQKHFIVIVTLCLGAFYMLIFHWWYTRSYVDPISVRFYLIFSVLCAISPMFYWAHRPFTRPRASLWVFVLALMLFLLHHPLAAKGRFIRGHLYTKEAEAIHKFLKSYGTDRILVILSTPIEIYDLDIPMASFPTANQNAEILLTDLERGFYRDIIVVERGWHESFWRREMLDPQVYNLELLEQYQVTSRIYNRISRVVKSKK